MTAPIGTPTWQSDDEATGFYTVEDVDKLRSERDALRAKLVDSETVRASLAGTLEDANRLAADLRAKLAALEPEFTKE